MCFFNFFFFYQDPLFYSVLFIWGILLFFRYVFRNQGVISTCFHRPNQSLLWSKRSWVCLSRVDSRRHSRTVVHFCGMFNLRKSMCFDSFTTFSGVSVSLTHWETSLMLSSINLFIRVSTLDFFVFVLISS